VILILWTNDGLKNWLDAAFEGVLLKTRGVLPRRGSPCLINRLFVLSWFFTVLGTTTIPAEKSSEKLG
jgi:hypothetical protein